MNEEVTDALNKLLQRNVDAAKGFSEAGNNIEAGELRTFLFKLSGIHEKFVKQLRTLVLLEDTEPKDASSIEADLHRFWIDLKSQITNNDTEAVLEECVRGEETILENYHDMLENKTMPAEVRHLLSQQWRSIKDIVETVKTEKAFAEDGE